MQRVNKAFNKLITVSEAMQDSFLIPPLTLVHSTDPFFDRHLFRSQPPSTEVDDKTELHPIFDYLNILEESPTYITIYRTVGRRYVVTELELCRTEMGTYPSSSRVRLTDFGEEALETTVSNNDGRGVTISQLLDAVVDLWGEDSDVTYPEPWEMGDFDGRPPTPRLLSLYELESNSGSLGYELVLDEVDEEEMVVLSPSSLPSEAASRCEPEHFLYNSSP